MDGPRDPVGIRGSVVHNRFANGGWGKSSSPPMGWDIDHVYWISMGVEEVDRNEMDSTYRYITSGRNMLTAIDRIKTCPGVEAVGAADVHAAYGREPVHACCRERFDKCRVREATGSDPVFWRCLISVPWRARKKRLGKRC